MNARELIAAAQTLAAKGIPVFPCAATKRPAIPKDAGGRGFLDATCDPDEVRRLFGHRGARLIGVPTGEASDLDCLDLDYRHGAAAWEQANFGRLPETRVHQTQSGGRHLLFLHAPGVRNTASSIAPGVDVRGEGGYIIQPPSTGYTVISDAEPVHWPDWLLRLVLPPPRPAPSPHPAANRTPVSSERTERFIRAALDRVRRAGEGQKHFMLRNSGLLLGGIQDQAGFSTAEAVRWLLDALPASVRDRRAAETTAAWGIENGRKSPVTLEVGNIDRSPDPRRKETARVAFRLLRMGVPSAELLDALRVQNRHRVDPLPEPILVDTAIWAARRLKDAPHVR